MSAACCIAILAKAPRPGYAKTRLAPALGAAGAAALAERLLEQAVAQAMAASLGPVVLWAAPDTTHPAFARLRERHGMALAVQVEGDLGARMAHVFETTLAASAMPLLLMGTDAPALDGTMLRQAAAALRDHDAVFVPALDGGYALVSLRAWGPRELSLFTDMPWSTPDVMAETRKRLAAAGLCHAELPAVADIDEPADLLHLPAGWPQAAAVTMPDRSRCCPAMTDTPTPPEDAAPESAPAAAPVAAPAVAELSPAACAARLAELFPALFGAGRALPIKLRIQADIQQRAPGIFSRKSLSPFLHRYTTSTAYLKALVNSEHRFDLDGAPAGEIEAEHRQAAAAELERRRSLFEARRIAERAAANEARRTAEAAARQQHAAEDQARRDRAAMLRAYESSTLTRANFCALKGIAEADLDGQLHQAWLEREQRAQEVRPAADRNLLPPEERRPDEGQEKRNGPRPDRSPQRPRGTTGPKPTR